MAAAATGGVADAAVVVAIPRRDDRAAAAVVIIKAVHSAHDEVPVALALRRGISRTDAVSRSAVIWRSLAVVGLSYVSSRHACMMTAVGAQLPRTECPLAPVLGGYVCGVIEDKNNERARNERVTCVVDKGHVTVPKRPTSGTTKNCHF